MDLKDFGVVIPAYNAEGTIGNLIEELVNNGFSRENIIIVDDGSKDSTAEVVRKHGVTVIKGKKNIGKGWALNLGFDSAKAKQLRKTFTLDADGQHHISEIKNFLKSEKNFDLLIGSRYNHLLQMPFSRRVVNRITSLVISLLSRNYIPDVQSGYRLINLRIFDKIKLKSKNFQTESELVYKVIKNKFTIGYIPISAVYDSEKSYINPLIDTIRFINMAVRFLWG